MASVINLSMESWRISKQKRNIYIYIYRSIERTSGGQSSIKHRVHFARRFNFNRWTRERIRKKLDIYIYAAYKSFSLPPSCNVSIILHGSIIQSWRGATDTNHSPPLPLLYNSVNNNHIHAPPPSFGQRSSRSLEGEIENLPFSPDSNQLSKKEGRSEGGERERRREGA